MKRKLFISMMAAALAFSALPAAPAAAKTTTTTIVESDDTDNQWDDESEGLDDDDEGTLTDEDNAGELTKYDIRATSAKKTIKAGKSFYIDIIPEDDTEWEDMPDEEWDELCEENIDEITFRSTNSSVASVNKKTGLVKAKRKGTAVIKTQINLANGEYAVYRTKVYVTR